MTVASSINRSGPYAGAGTVGPFPVGFYFLDNTHLLAVRRDVAGAEATLVLGVDYTVAGAGAPGGGFLTLTSALASGYQLTISRNVPLTQLLDYTQSDSFPAESHESGLDKLTMALQQVDTKTIGALRVPEIAGIPLLPSASARAGTLLAWDALGNPASVQIQDPGSFTYGVTTIDRFTGNGAQTAFTLSASPGVLANLEVVVGGVEQDAGTDFLWTSGTLLTFTTPPPATSIRVKYVRSLPMGTSDSALVQFSSAGSYAAGTVGRYLTDLAGASGSSAVGFSQTGTGAVLRTLQQKSRDIVSVLDFGAKLDGLTDDTPYFNLATQATAAWSMALQYDVYVPGTKAGKAKLNGSVYIRKGQTLRGSGSAAYVDATGNTTTNVFVMGKGLIAGVPTDDPGGQPVRVQDIFVLGGAANKGVFFCNAPGFSMSNLWCSAVGIGVEINGGADGLINNLEIDQALTGISLTACQNIAISNFNIYLPNYAIVVNSDVRDVMLANGVIEYPQFAGVYFNVSTSNIRAFNVSNVNFTMNAQYGTFLGYVVSSANGVDAIFAGCSFRNWPGYAVSHTTGVTASLIFTGCVFDGNRTTTAYTQSTTAKVLQTVTTGGDGTYIFQDCTFRNLIGEIAQINDGCTKLALIGGSVVGCDANAVSQKRFNVVTVLPMSITVKGVIGFPYVFTSGSNRCASLPWWGASTTWRMAIKGNTQGVGDSYYSAAEESIFAVSWQNVTATKSIFVDRINLWQTASRTNPGQLTSVACLGVAPGGATSTTTFAATGSITVSVPFTNAANFDFYAETAV